MLLPRIKKFYRETSGFNADRKMGGGRVLFGLV
jgi:hypothetical protein